MMGKMIGTTGYWILEVSWNPPFSGQTHIIHVTGYIYTPHDHIQIYPNLSHSGCLFLPHLAGLVEG